MVTVRVLLAPPDDWIGDDRPHLNQVMHHWAPMLSVQGDKSPPADQRASKGDPA
ncbi:hypothetical protein SAMN05421806_1344 [Streptomyces indicus]|uniref:Uncharacterized protein n=2 Tax=Streptomyces indicus TaxID=417292 RepID=A0A1G9JPS0_9ACTN|nr:hypothetical protein SAMN05421806_1344 [Streptomyces indicus]